MAEMVITAEAGLGDIVVQEDTLRALGTLGLVVLEVAVAAVAAQALLMFAILMYRVAAVLAAALLCLGKELAELAALTAHPVLAVVAGWGAAGAARALVAVYQTATRQGTVERVGYTAVAALLGGINIFRLASVVIVQEMLGQEREVQSA